MRNRPVEVSVWCGPGPAQNPNTLVLAKGQIALAPLRLNLDRFLLCVLGMGTDHVADHLRDLLDATGADLAWISNIAVSDDVPCFGNIWVTPGDHPEAERLRSLEGSPIPSPKSMLTPQAGALDHFDRDATGLTGTRYAVHHFACSGLEIRARIAVGANTKKIPTKNEKAGMRVVPQLVGALPKPMSKAGGELVLLYNQDGELLYVGGDMTHFERFIPVVEHIQTVLETGGPAVILGASVSVQVIEGPNGPIYRTTLKPAESIRIPPERVLTPFERVVARQAANGATVEDIAEELGRRRETIHWQLRSACQKLGVARVGELAPALGFTDSRRRGFRNASPTFLKVIGGAV